MFKHMNRVVLAGALAASVCTGLARAADEIHVEEWRCTTGCGSHSCTTSLHSTTHYDSGEAIAIVITECTRRINIYADSESFNIGQVTITHTGTLPPDGVELFIGQGSFPYGMGQSSAAAGNLAGIDIDNEDLRDKVWLAGHIAGNQGIVLVGKVYRWDVGGVMTGGLRAESSPDAEHLFRVYAGATNAVAIKAVTGTITHIEITGNSAAAIDALDEGIETVVIGGNFTGSAEAGDFVGSVTVAGDIGTVNGSPVQIKTFNTGGTIGTIQADNINANITAGGTGGTGDITRVFATSNSFFKGAILGSDLLGDGSEPAIEAAGDLDATLTVNGDLDGAVEIAGDLDADITVQGSVNAPIEIGGALLASRTIKIYITLDGDASITMGDTDRLKGQIIIDADGFDQGSWDGDVVVGSTTLSPTAYYDELPSALGGGAVGLVGFNFHGWACVPEHEEVLSSPPASVVVDHYGPVINGTLDTALKVEHRPAGSSGGWMDQTSAFTISVETTAPYRRVAITPTGGNAFLDDKEYRITPQLVSEQTGVTRLKCRYDSNTLSIVPYDYRFTIQAGSFAP